jgi:hypothetical protein
VEPDEFKVLFPLLEEPSIERQLQLHRQIQVVVAKAISVVVI